MADTRKKSPSSPARPKSASSQEKQRIREKETAEAEKLHRSKRLHDEIWAIVIIALGVLAVLSLHTQLIGSLGAAAHSVLFGIFGRVSYFLAYFLILYGLLIFLGKTSYLTIRSLLCLLILFICVCVLNASLYEGLGTELSFGLIKEAYSAQTSNIGVFGAVAGTLLNRLTGLVGMRIIGVCGVVVTLMFIIDTPISVFFDNMKIKSAARRNTRNAQRAANEMILERAAKERLERAAQASKEAEAARQPAAQPAAAPESKAREAERALFETAGDGAPAAEDELPSFNPYFTPESIGRKSADSANGAYTNRQKQIIDYVTDDTLFGQRGTITEGYGLNAEKPSSFAASQEAPAASHAVSEVPSGGKGESARASVSPAGRQDAAAAVAAKEAEELKSEPSYKFPPIDILRRPSAGKDGGNKAQLSQQARVLEETLASFGVSASVENMIKGPTVTRFEVHPAAGVKVSRIVSLQDDLALNLRAKSLRIEAPIPGKAAVGIEISNDVTSPVLLREVLESKEFREAGSKISVGLGRNVGGGSVVANLRSMPHLLIAGATGSGKSVCINSIILSLLYKAEPSEVKLILVDPKVVELSNYNGIPHLLIPVVTEPAKASAALGWAVGEMNERYNRFAEESVRDLESYNETVRANGEEDKVLPQIVIVIDELADLMMAAQNAVEDSICRLAQKARAAGMHMVIATQRPSVDVITGVIKANVPSRIAFAVSSQVDSRTILDMSGAEKLVGKGDMLYYPQGMPKPERVQGCFVSDEEVNKVIQFLKDGAKEEVRYNSDVIRAMNSGASGAGGNGGSSDSDEDELLADAIECVVRAEQASVSMLQRRFRIGYNRSARLIDLMEERGIVGPADGSRPRKVLLSVAQFEQLESESSPDEGVPEEIF